MTSDRMHELVGAIATIRGVVDTVERGLKETQEMLSQIAREETSTQREESAKVAPEHPETLETEEEYKKAPRGTIVAANGGEPYMRRDGWVRGDSPYGSPYMAHMSRRVLRWGWDK